jgi:hypothetical protein
MAHASSTHMVCLLAFQHVMFLKQFDIKAAFVTADIDCDILL